MSSLTKESFKASEFIFFEGDIETHFYIIESGEVLIFTKDPVGKKIEIARLKSGDTFGEFALIDTGARSASAQALVDTKVMKISSEGYDMMLNDLPSWASSMLRSFSSRLKNMNSTLKEIKASLRK
ncbi:MAG: cyclic nucleotide-binding domain-containing protein [Pseudobdellovibrio sp.]